MIRISHRVNTIDLLDNTPAKYGVEVDIRSKGNDLIIHHDPFKNGGLFEDWLQSFKHKTLILNVKEEGLEDQLLELMVKYKINDFFFLDQSFPFLVKTAKLGEKRCAIRVSEYESIDTALSLAGNIEWVWVDCFTRFPLSYDNAYKLQLAGFKLCFVSPELQGRSNPRDVCEFRANIDKLGIKGDAVCTKLPNLWA